MEFKLDTQEQKVVVHIKGMLTFDDHENFKKIVETIGGTISPLIEINLAETVMIDSAGIGMLLLANDQAKQSDKSLVLTGVSGHVAKVVELSKIDQLIPVE
jgi:anti-anti-sigma factor